MPDRRFLLVDAAVLPDVFLKVLQAKELLASGAVNNISTAARQAGISRSAFYKYKDTVFDAEAGRESITVVATLLDKTGALQSLLSGISAAGASIADADVLVVVGRGIGSKKNLPLMRRLAELLGAELGCTRPLVEAGWLEYRHQVGQTGVSVSPRLLVSVGVSGAIQHLAGIGGAQAVIAINEDPDAPIFGASDCCVVGDCIEVVGELVRLLEERG